MSKTLELHLGIRVTGDVAKAKEILNRAIATGLIASVVHEIAVKGKRIYVSFSKDMESTNAERANAVCHIAPIAREMETPDCRVAFDSYADWLKGMGLREVNGECERS